MFLEYSCLYFCLHFHPDKMEIDNQLTEEETKHFFSLFPNNFKIFEKYRNSEKLKFPTVKRPSKKNAKNGKHNFKKQKTMKRRSSVDVRIFRNSSAAEQKHGRSGTQNQV